MGSIFLDRAWELFVLLSQLGSIAPAGSNVIFSCCSHRLVVPSQSTASKIISERLCLLPSPHPPPHPFCPWRYPHTCSVRNGIAKAKVPKVAPEVLCQLILRLMDQRGGHITSRDLGRELNMTTVDKEGTKALSVIKDVRRHTLPRRGGDGAGAVEGQEMGTASASAVCFMS